MFCAQTRRELIGVKFSLVTEILFILFEPAQLSCINGGRFPFCYYRIAFYKLVEGVCVGKIRNRFGNSNFGTFCRFRIFRQNLIAPRGQQDKPLAILRYSVVGSVQNLIGKANAITNFPQLVYQIVEKLRVLA